MYISLDEYYNEKILALPNYIYNAIVDKFTEVFCSHMMAEGFVRRHWNDSIEELSLNSYVDLMGMFKII